MGKMVRKGECKACGKCCKYERVVVPYTPALENYYKIRAHKVVREGNKLVVWLNSRCKFLDDNNKCMIHDFAIYPILCRVFPTVPEGLYIDDCGYYFEEEEEEE